jgi:hypothetical protein
MRRLVWPTMSRHTFSAHLICTEYLGQRNRADDGEPEVNGQLTRTLSARSASRTSGVQLLEKGILSNVTPASVPLSLNVAITPGRRTQGTVDQPGRRISRIATPGKMDYSCSGYAIGC